MITYYVANILVLENKKSYPTLINIGTIGLFIVTFNTFLMYVYYLYVFSNNINTNYTINKE